MIFLFLFCLSVLKLGLTSIVHYQQNGIKNRIKSNLNNYSHRCCRDFGLNKPLRGGRFLYPRLVHSVGHKVRGEGWGVLGSSGELHHKGEVATGCGENELPQGLGLVEII